jgi:hypothetical protein
VGTAGQQQVVGNRCCQVICSASMWGVLQQHAAHPKHGCTVGVCQWAGWTDSIKLSGAAYSQGLHAFARAWAGSHCEGVVPWPHLCCLGA